MNPTHLPLRQETQVKDLILFNPVAPVFASLLLVVLKMVASDIGNLGLLYHIVSSVMTILTKFCFNFV